MMEGMAHLDALLSYDIDSPSERHSLINWQAGRRNLCPFPRFVLVLYSLQLDSPLFFLWYFFQNFSFYLFPFFIVVYSLKGGLWHLILLAGPAALCAVLVPFFSAFCALLISKLKWNFILRQDQVTYFRVSPFRHMKNLFLLFYILKTVCFGKHRMQGINMFNEERKIVVNFLKYL